MSELYDLVNGDYNIILGDLQKHNISRVVLSPNRWNEYVDLEPLEWNIIQLEPDEVVQHLPEDQHGIYSFIVKPNIADHSDISILIYIGKAEKQSLRDRVLQYFNERNRTKGRSTIKRMFDNWEGYLWVCYSRVINQELIKPIEENLISAFVPPYNQQYPGHLGAAMRAWQ